MNIEESKSKFFRNVKRLRERQGKSIEELSKLSGVPVGMLEQLEQNTLPEEMMVSDAYKLAKVFHCNTHELFQ